MPHYLAAARLTNPRVRFVGVALNTAAVEPRAAEALLARTAAETGLPCVDPIRTGVAPIVDILESL
jgi:uncharacterized NAD-dependent epimerase/dehydratase family protein